MLAAKLQKKKEGRVASTPWRPLVVKLFGDQRDLRVAGGLVLDSAVDRGSAELDRKACRKTDGVWCLWCCLDFDSGVGGADAASDGSNA